MKTYRHRDLTVVETDNDFTVVIACDSCGSVGEKPMDELKVPAKITGRYTARVALMEVLSSGAQIISVTDAVSCEMEPTGNNIIAGIKKELEILGLPSEILSGSTEENFITHSTGLGVTVVGMTKGKPRFTKSLSGDLVACIGLPKVGSEINLEGDNQIAEYKDIFTLLAQEEVREIIPCGSKGIAYEAAQAAEYSKLKFEAYCETPDLMKSAGPATCLVATFDHTELLKLQTALGEKLRIIGRLV